MSFIPPSSKQYLSINNSDARINIWTGAVRSGKTYASLWRFVKELIHGPSGEYAIITRTYDSFKRNLEQQIFDIVGADARHYSGKRELHLWGKKVHIIGADDERAESKIRGATFSGAYCDELSILPESVFKMLISRCAMGKAKIFATTNPDSPSHWVKKDFLENNPDVKYWDFFLEDNPKLKQDEKDYLHRQYKGVWFQRFIEGKWVQAEGAIYASLDIIDYAPILPEYWIVGVDYGTTNPFSMVLVGVSKKSYPNIWVANEYYFDSRVHQRQKTDIEYAQDLIEFTSNKAISAIYVDPSAASFKVELQKQGVQNVYDALNEVNDGIRCVSAMMAGGTLKICRNCTHLIKEMQGYVWDVKSYKTGIEKPLKENDHACDALRYAIYSHFFGKDHDGLKPEDIDKFWFEAKGGLPELPRFFQDKHDDPRYIF